jgi:hypothetical protein
MGDEIDEFADVKPKFKDPLGGTLEGCKFAYFSKEDGKYEEFIETLRTTPFHFYRVEYKFSAEKEGSPDFAARNLNTAFASELDDCRKQFFCVFRCMRPDLSKKEYVYTSFWISTVPAENETDTTFPDIKTLIGSRYDDYRFTKVSDLDAFLADFKSVVPAVHVPTESDVVVEPAVDSVVPSKTTSDSYDDDFEEYEYVPEVVEEPTNCVSEVYVH